MAAMALQLDNVTIADLEDPFANMDPKEVIELQKTTNIRPIKREVIDAAMKHFKGDLQELASVCAYLSGDQKDPRRFDEHLTVHSAMNSFSTVSFPAKFKELCERGIIAGFRLVEPCLLYTSPSPRDRG